MERIAFGDRTYRAVAGPEPSLLSPRSQWPATPCEASANGSADFNGPSGLPWQSASP